MIYVSINTVSLTMWLQVGLITQVKIIVIVILLLCINSFPLLKNTSIFEIILFKNKELAPNKQSRLGR